MNNITMIIMKPDPLYRAVGSNLLMIFRLYAQARFDRICTLLARHEIELDLVELSIVKSSIYPQLYFFYL